MCRTVEEGGGIMRTKRRWCYFCDKVVKYERIMEPDRYYHRCPVAGFPVEMRIGNVRWQRKVERKFWRIADRRDKKAGSPRPAGEAGLGGEGEG